MLAALKATLGENWVCDSQAGHAAPHSLMFPHGVSFLGAIGRE